MAKMLLDNRITEIVIRVMVLASFVGMLIVGGRQYEFSRCLAAYDNAVSVATNQRLAAAEQDRAAQDQLFDSISSDPPHGLAALQTYNLARHKADELRKANPLPAPPSQRC